MNFYNLSPVAGVLSQGDIIRGLPFTTFALSDVDTTDQEGSSFETAVNGAEGGLTASFMVCDGILLNQSCDLDNSDVGLLVARIWPAESKYKELGPAKSTKAVIKEIKERFSAAGKTPRYFYLPACVEIELPRSIVRIHEIQTFNREDFGLLCSKRVASLTEPAQCALQEKLAILLR